MTEKKDGLSTSWNQKGQIAQKIEYKNDKYHGLFEQYYENGQIMSQRNYEEGLKSGLFREWSFNGSLLKETKWDSSSRPEKQISIKCWDEEGNEIECE